MNTHTYLRLIGVFLAILVLGYVFVDFDSEVVESPSSDHEVETEVRDSNSQEMAPIAGTGTPRSLEQDHSPGRVDSSREEVTPSTSVTIHLRRISKGNPGAGVAGVVVLGRHLSVKGSNYVRLGVTDELGRLETSLARDGAYRFEVELRTLPEDLNPPGHFKTGDLVWPGLTREEHKVDAGEPAELTLWCLEARTLSGHVLGPDGEASHGAWVQMIPKDPNLEALHCQVSTNDKGAFRFEHLYPIEYRVRIKWLGGRWRNRDDRRASSRYCYPPPYDVDLRGVNHSFVELSSEAGPATVRGRVVDENGEPFSDVSIQLSYFEPLEARERGVPRGLAFDDDAGLARTKTRADGSFRIENLHPVRMRLLVAASEALQGTRGERRVALLPDLVEVPPSSFDKNTAVLPDIVVRRSHTFEVNGKVQLTADELDGHSLALKNLILQAHFDDAPADDAVRFGEQTEPFNEYYRHSGKFRVSCDTPRKRMTIRIHRMGSEQLYKDFVFYPTADGVEKDVELLFP